MASSVRRVGTSLPLDEFDRWESKKLTYRRILAEQHDFFEVTRSKIAAASIGYFWGLNQADQAKSVQNILENDEIGRRRICCSLPASIAEMVGLLGDRFAVGTSTVMRACAGALMQLDDCEAVSRIAGEISPHDN